MDITLPQPTLAAALTRAANTAEKKSTSAIFTCALIRATGDGITVAATDKSLTYTGAHAAKVDVPGEVAVPVADFLTVVKMLPNGPVRCVLQANGKLKITAGSATYTLSAYAASEFPPSAAVTDTKTMTIAASDLRRVLDQTLTCVAPEDNRYGLNGAHIEELGGNNVAPGTLRIVSTDGNRLNYSEAPFSGELGIGRKMLLPRAAAEQIRRLLDGYEGPVDLAFGLRAAVFSIPGVTLTMRLLEADFPDYRQVLPTTFKRRAIIDRAELLSALLRVKVFAKDGANTVRFKFAADTLSLTSRKLDAGDAADEVAIEMSGEPMQIGFNAEFVAQALKGMAGARVIVEMGDPLSPCMMRDPEDDRARCIVMPVRVTD